jgi:DNA-binding response OmpR family regulator
MASTESNGHANVLVVEDDHDINELVGAYVQIAGFEYRPALDGTTALREARSRLPSAVILDLMLPDIDGFEVCKQLKSDQATQRVPVIMLTALGGEKNREKGQACGAIEYLQKPFDPDRLMEVLARHAGKSNGEK